MHERNLSPNDEGVCDMTVKTKQPAKAAKTVFKTATVKIDPPTESPAEVKAVETEVAKPAKAAKPAPKVVKVVPIVPTTKEVKGEKHKKPKMIRDSFTMPEGDYAHIAALKARCLKAGVSAKKSEILRAALKFLSSVSDLELTNAISDLDVIKTGRPAKG